MKVLQSINRSKLFYFKASITPRSPASGFSFAFGSTGESQVFNTGIVFSGRNGLIFDQSGNFFGGYYSGRQSQIEGHVFENRLSYFYEDSLVNNNIVFDSGHQISGGFNCFEFDKIEDSSLLLNLNYVSPFTEAAPLPPIVVTGEGLQDINGIFLISSDNYYILPII
jgi:hypothetical protein